MITDQGTKLGDLKIQHERIAGEADE